MLLFERGYYMENNITENKKIISRDKIIVRTSIIGIGANILLAGFKAIVGMLSHSIAIVLDAVNNLSDAGSSLITIIGTKLAAKQPDKKHPWGHGRIEYLSAILISIIVLYAGFTSFTKSVQKIISPETPDYSPASLIIVLAAVFVKIILGTFVKRTGKKVNSDSLVNSGKDALMDSLISASTLAAAVIFLITGKSLEAWLGAIISLIIIKSGIDMLQESISHLLGERVSFETAQSVQKCIMSFPEVMGVYDLIFHDYGPDRLNCSVHVEIPDTMTAVQIDELGRAVTTKLYNELGVIMTAMSVYSMNTNDTKATAIREDISQMLLSQEHIIQLHGFYFNDTEKLIQFDIIVSFDAPDRLEVYRKAVAMVAEKYPDYHIACVLDSDFCVSE